MIFKEYVEIWQKEKQEFVKATTMSAYKLLVLIQKCKTDTFLKI